VLNPVVIQFVRAQQNGGGAGDPVSDPDEQSSKRPRVEGEEEVVDETSPQVSAAAARVYQLSRRADLLPGAGLPPELSTALALRFVPSRYMISFNS
jgi:hypothetical protein